ncbi:MAG: DUF333 domain-containing protein [Patescibacteria group bacterium]
MFNKVLFSLTFILGPLLIMSGCSLVKKNESTFLPSPSPSREQKARDVPQGNTSASSSESQGEQPDYAGMANPAAVYCLEHGGTLEITKDAEGGERGLCKFSDGTECDEWKFFRGECKSVELE